MEPDLFYVCGVRAERDKGYRYVVFKGSELAGRLDVEAEPAGFSTEGEAIACIHAKGGYVPDEPALYLDFFDDERMDTVWCWKDERTGGVSQIFKTKRQALSALRRGRLIFTVMTD
jgi:hypothetical protein